MKTATIVIRDEVNIKVEGLDLDARRTLVDRKSTRLNSSHVKRSRMPSSA